jgi:hypothetical protein
LDLEIDRPDPVFVGAPEVGSQVADFAPRIEIVIAESAFFLVDHLGDLAVQKTECPANAHDVDCHVEPIEH